VWNKELQGITVENTRTSYIAIGTITVTWANTHLVEEIRIDNSRIWKHNNEGLPTGTQIDVVDYVITAGTNDPGAKIKFNGNMTGDTFTTTIKMSNGSTYATGSITS
jgi:hypothetical protein